MAKTREYFDLVASLPALPYFDGATRNPINADRLDDRLRILEPDDYEIWQRVRGFLDWHRQPRARTDEEMLVMAQRMLRGFPWPIARHVVENRLHQRIILAALRARRRDLPPPLLSAPSLAGELGTTILRNWSAPDFNLAGVYPWIPGAARMLENRDALGLDRLMFRAEWRWLDSLEYASPFSFGALLAYLFQWDILNQWLSNDAIAAAEHFQELTAEVTSEHEQIFT